MKSVLTLTSCMVIAVAVIFICFDNYRIRSELSIISKSLHVQEQAIGVRHDHNAELSEIGRHQLFQGSFLIEGGDKIPAVFLIDTCAGVVKEYTNGRTKDGKAFSFWAPTEDE